MDYQKTEAYTDLQINDIVKIKGQKGHLYNIRMIQEIRNSRVYFEFKLKNSEWVKRKEVTVIKKIN